MTLYLGIVILLAAAIAVYVYTTRVKTVAATGWPVTEGVILESRVAARNEPGADRPAVRYGAVVVYEYAVAGKTLRGDRIRFEGTHWRLDPAGAEADLKAYPVGRRVLVRYDPARPTEAVLEIGG